MSALRPLQLAAAVQRSRRRLDRGQEMPEARTFHVQGPDPLRDDGGVAVGVVVADGSWDDELRDVDAFGPKGLVKYLCIGTLTGKRNRRSGVLRARAD